MGRYIMRFPDLTEMHKILTKIKIDLKKYMACYKKGIKMIKIIMMTKSLRTRSSLQVTILGFNQAIFKALVSTN